ncbi:MAG: hypothetical protein RIN55_04915 [Tissierellaceae bacterium]|nr:hypothetical protein [Tissierellaceae bacterium]
MESLIVFVIIIALNVVTKSVQDKKKIERARMKRTEELKNNPPPKPKVTERVNRAERSGRNLAEERTRKMENGQRPQYDYKITEDKSNEKNITKDKNIAQESAVTDKYADNKILKEIQEETQKELRGGFDNKKLVNAIIWSEILAEPKSIQNIKKGM